MLNSPNKGGVMFIGSFKYSIDAKGRVALPAKLRKFVKQEANDTFVMTRGTVKCIDVYPWDKWEELVAGKLNNLNTFNPKDAMFIRMFTDKAESDSLDSQGRLSLSKNLIEYAGIQREVLILGAVKKIEIWNPDTYEAYIKENLEQYAEIAKEVMKI